MKTGQNAKRIRTDFRLPTWLVTALERAAEERGQTKTAIVEQALRAALDEATAAEARRRVLETASRYGVGSGRQAAKEGPKEG